MDKEVVTWFRMNRPAGWVWRMPKEIPVQGKLVLRAELFDLKSSVYLHRHSPYGYLYEWWRCILAENTRFHLTNQAA